MFTFSSLDELRASDVFQFSETEGPEPTTPDTTDQTSTTGTTVSSVTGSTTVTSTDDAVDVDIDFDIEGTATGQFEGTGSNPTGTVTQSVDTGSVDETPADPTDPVDASPVDAVMDAAEDEPAPAVEPSGTGGLSGLSLEDLFAMLDSDGPGFASDITSDPSFTTTSSSSTSSVTGSVLVTSNGDDVDVVINAEGTGNVFGAFFGAGETDTASASEFEQFSSGTFSAETFAFDFF